ncbi:hypothetical protein EW146_g5678 [Bondarzewia mesenterica]|uniref:MARVEL domain-containing protein n=1 Tax=Bondarzewia mesenterica TaxID=1095465 RepID=A0A4V3XER5_9AGAM|nr:hypothetical protein EW146_g5678 [Bondarzewia mesenterica]
MVYSFHDRTRDSTDSVQVFVLALTATVLGLSAYFASIFLPNLHHDFTIFSLVAPSWTILILVVLLIRSTPRLEVFCLFVTAVLWLTMGAWSSDTIGAVECFSMGNQRTPTKNGEISARTYCYDSKVIEAFSWTIFICLVFFFIIIIALANKSQVMGRPFIWQEPIFELPWFGQAPGWPGVSYSAYPQMYGGGGPMMMGGTPGMMGGTPGMIYAGGNVIQQQPGHSVVIQPGVNGQPPTISQYPAVAAVFGGYAILQGIPQTMHALTMSQTSVAMFAISSLMVFIVLHHRRSGNVLTESQEEMILIGALGLFSFAVLVAWRAITQQGVVGITGETSLTDATSKSRGGSARWPSRLTGRRRPWPCPPGDDYCVVEEWSYF